MDFESDEFEWSEVKCRQNIEEHAVDFRRAALIFSSPVLEARDSRQDYGEERWRALGHVDDQYFVVAYARRGKRRRIISAWKVGNDGKRRYQALLSQRS